MTKTNPDLSRPSGEFWLGLENIHSLSKQGQYVLEVELSDWAGERQTERYQFQLEGEKKKFAVHLEASSGDQEEIIVTGASGLPFSTADRDNDLAGDANCAELLSGTTVLLTSSLKAQFTQITHSHFLMLKLS